MRLSFFPLVLVELCFYRPLFSVESSQLRGLYICRGSSKGDFEFFRERTFCKVHKRVGQEKVLLIIFYAVEATTIQID